VSEAENGAKRAKTRVEQRGSRLRKKEMEQSKAERGAEHCSAKTAER